MSTSIVHVMTIAGKSAASIEAACVELLHRRNPSKSWGTSDWTVSDHRAIAHFCKNLLAGARKLPVVYYASYVDAWDVADSRFTLLTWPDGVRGQICGADVGLAFYPSRFAADLLKQIPTMADHQAEDRWYLARVKDAIDAASCLEREFLVVCISEVIGPSRTDEQILAALEVDFFAQGSIE